MHWYSMWCIYFSVSG